MRQGTVRVAEDAAPSTVGRYAGRVAIVTGASRGIGRAIARRLSDEGASVVLTARSAEGLEDAAGDLPPDRVRTVAGRAQDPAHREEAVATAVREFGAIDVLVNNAGINPVYGPLAELDAEAARKVLEVNVIGTLAWVQEAVRAGLGSRAGAAVLNMSSVTGAVPSEGIGWYGVSKAAVSHLTVTLAAELGPRIRVNALAPAVVRTQFARALYEGREDEVAATYPMRRLGDPEDVAAAAAFLCSDEAGWISGQVLTLDGGLLAAGGTA
ncbi:SDR family oxidoreductase [Demequina sp. SYSU T00192]|uniref:SDR family oxidoreductase n=1 Tax=Demequina litoralis TaxID=3051660 RepID=A0ABT8G683_9MICO|nr:SDR family oxidoreductase [Demequina sp. SYSU T00192]MDN4474656.1 SDR family oxidoreductase [Demequina sp. SYSU T00192]